MNTQMLFRASLSEEGELQIASEYFDTVDSRSLLQDSLVICRYSALPFYEELEKDLLHNNCAMINTYEQHRWIADFDYYDVIKEFTFESWNKDNFYTCDYHGPFVVKGSTNSKKFQWDSMMYAETHRRAVEISCDLLNDGIIGTQNIIYRKFEPLVNFGTRINGLPISNEWRFFFYRDQMLSYGFYWTELDKPPGVSPECIALANKVAGIVSQYVNFFVLDVAQKLNGDWVVVEINDGQMSGLSLNDPREMYGNLKRCLTGKSSVGLKCPLSSEEERPVYTRKVVVAESTEGTIEINTR